MPNYYQDHEALKELGREIARLLGTFWSLDEDNDWGRCAVIKGQDGAAIHISPTRTPAGRLAISGDYPLHKFIHDLDTLRITVSAEKNAATIVKDIRQRFLPKYLSTYRIAMERKQRYEEREALRHERLQALAKAMGSETRNGRVYISRVSPGYGHLEMQEGQAETVSINVGSIPFETAHKIAALLAKGD